MALCDFFLLAIVLVLGAISYDAPFFIRNSNYRFLGNGVLLTEDSEFYYMNGYCFKEFFSQSRLDKIGDICDSLGSNCLGFSRDPASVTCFLLVFQNEELVDTAKIVSENKLVLDWTPKGVNGGDIEGYRGFASRGAAARPPNQHGASKALGKGWRGWTAYIKEKERLF